MKTIRILNKKEQDFLKELYEKDGFYKNQITFRYEDDNFRKKYEKEIATLLDNLLEHDRGSEYFEYLLNKEGLKIQKHILKGTYKTIYLK